MSALRVIAINSFVLHSVPEPPKEASPLQQQKDVPAVLKAEDLWKSYQMGSETVHALRGVSLEILPREYVAIMGPSGSGKSTLMNLIGCLDSPTKGQLWFNGKLVSELDDEELAHVRNREIGFVFQTFNLLPRASALSNVELPLVYRGISPADRHEFAKRALKMVELENRMDHRPSELSGGQRQRVAIARALVGNPSIVLADEPTGNLDSRTGAGILKLFQQLNESGHTLIVVTHERAVAEHAQRIIHIRDGQIAQDERLR